MYETCKKCYSVYFQFFLVNFKYSGVSRRLLRGSTTDLSKHYQIQKLLILELFKIPYLSQELSSSSLKYNIRIRKNMEL